MHHLVENFLERPLKQKIILGGVSIFLLIVLLWYIAYQPLWEERSALKEKLQTLKDSIRHEQHVVKNLPIFREEVRTLDKKLELALLELPDKKQIPDLLSSISILAIDTGLEVLKFAPQPEALQDFFASVPVVVELEGTFHQLATFFDEVGHLARIVNITDITIDIVKEARADILIRAGCLITTFRYLDEDERAAQEEAKQESKRRKGKK